MAKDDGAPDHRLELAPEAMRAFGYAVIDAIVDRLANQPALKVTTRRSRAELDAMLWEAAPRGPGEPARVLGRAIEDVLANCMIPSHPRFFAFVPGPSNFVGAMAESLAAGFNPFCGTWFEGSGAAEIEVLTIDWLRRAFGMPEGAGGLFVSGGSVANLTALAAARHVMLDDHVEGAVAYGSALGHGSLDKAFHVLGFRPHQFRRLAVDNDGRLKPAELERALAADRAAGLRPFLIIANAGTTNTGAVDPLAELARLAEVHGLWLHVDGAYGAAAAFTARGRVLLDGLGLAHSVVVDPHKWLFQPYEMGAVLVRDMAWLGRAFASEPDYMQDTAPKHRELNFCDHGIQLTRGFRALKLWMTIQVFGMDAIAAAIEHGMGLAEHAARLLDADPRFEVVTRPSLGVVTFRYLPANGMDVDAANRRLVGALIEDGFALATSTQIRGSTVLRFCTVNPRTMESDIAAVIERIAALGQALA
ncbi:MAG: aminotransferase class I/II-fold pyridoxal phosphate-dependent enzyme [Alphaproteobacteria bacterium]